MQLGAFRSAHKSSINQGQCLFRKVGSLHRLCRYAQPILALSQWIFIRPHVFPNGNHLFMPTVTDHRLRLSKPRFLSGTTSSKNHLL